ncbi:MAG: hypothetical protein WCO11_05200 [Sphingomonadales bacterium]|jgi:hypothetical protein
MIMPSRVAAALLCLAALTAAPARAANEIATTARGLFSNVRVAGAPATVVGPVNEVSGRTSPGYARSGGSPGFSQSVALGTVGGIGVSLNLNTGTIATAASANGTLPANTTLGSASASVDAVDLRLVSGNGPTPLLRLTAGNIQSTATAQILGGVLSRIGQSQFTNLSLSIGGQTILSLGNAAQVAPNFLAYDAGGLQVVLNQQFFSDMSTTRMLINNAVGISFTNYLIDGRRLNGNLLIGQSMAEYVGSAAVPEAATWAQLIAGFALTGSVARRQRHRKLRRQDQLMSYA